MMTKSDKPAALSRRNVLRAAGAAGVAAAAGALGAKVFSPAIAGPAPKIRLGWGDIAACHSPLGFGVAKGIYAKHNLDIELYPFTSNGQTVIQAIATGKADAGAGLIGDWLKPLEQGFDVKLFVGSHGGCGRLFASEKSGIKTLADLKGKTIATFVMGASPQTVLAGLDLQGRRRPERRRDLEDRAVRPRRRDGRARRGGRGHPHRPVGVVDREEDKFVHIADTQSGVLQGPHLLRARRQRQVPRGQQGRDPASRRGATSRFTNTPPTTPTRWRSGTPTI